MSATNQFELDMLDLIITNVDAPFIGDTAGLQNSAAPGSLEISLNTAALSDTSTTPASNEAAYTDYVRKAVVRSTGLWTVAAGQVDNDAEIAFVVASGGSETETYFGICLETGGNYLQLWGALDAGLAVSSGITPSFAAQALAITLD